MKPEYEKAAKALKDLVQVAAVNCDEDSNKSFCGSMGVQGFPTLKVVKPSKKPGKPVVEDYQGPRESKAIVEYLKAAIPNNVKRITDKGLSGWLSNNNETAKAILFSNKGSTGALIKVLATEFVGKVGFGQIRDKEKASVEMFGVTEYPTLVVLPGGNQDPVIYSGAFSKLAIKEFLDQYVPATAEKSDPKQKPMGKAKEKESSEEDKESSSSFSKASASHESSDATEEAAKATAETLEDNSNPTESPKPAVTPDEKPVQLPNLPEPIPALIEEQYLREKCLGERTSTCILALLPAVEGDDAVLPETATAALASLAELAQKHTERGGKLFPFFNIPFRNAGSMTLRDRLALGGKDTFELIAVNARRSWWRRFGGQDFGPLAVETWVDNIRFGEGEKAKLPEDLLATETVVKTATGEEETAVPIHEEL